MSHFITLEVFKTWYTARSTSG